MASPSPLMMRAALLLMLLSATSPCVATRNTPGGQFAGLNRITSKRRTIRHIDITQFRGGAIDSDEEYDSEEYDSDDEAEPIVVKAKNLASSTKNKVQKAKGAAAKAKVSVAMASSSSGGDGLGSLYRQTLGEKTSRAPNLDRASFLLRRPGWGVSAVLKAVFMDSSALEAKAKQGGGGKPKPKRKMRPGQAKTLSDLPQLSA
ncbi:hypothetical protein THAOC_37708 [Thalassiosira oceanica]|uniref:RxLR effector protein n=1 Tax=Thalassiosira oceanica TaxID=159749 RepID=K0QY76_THAOC|nr:hypothetical protein THAOC_37708 [Thalassiosira oceanica]|eukprot:EJK43813.1 hypothetical protein THAOC_37708 [Thalassiosira oceanica]